MTPIEVEDSILRSWGFRVKKGNPRVDLLEICEIKGDCWVASREFVRINNRRIHVQRAAYVLFEGPAVKSDVILCLCGTELCCWGGHLHRVPCETSKRRGKSRVANNATP